MNFRILALVPLAALTAHGAPCPPPTWTPPGQIDLGEGPALIVTHPSTQWDGRFVSKVGMDAAVAYAKQRAYPVVYLQDATPINGSTYFFSDCRPTHWVSSSGGEFSFHVRNRHVISVGGHWEMCQATTLTDLFGRQWGSLPEGNLKLTQVLDGIYSHPLSSMRTTDPYYPRLAEFLRIVTFGRPPSWPFPKTSLLENLGIIQDPALQVEYLKRQLPPYGALSSRYSVELVLNGVRAAMIRTGQGPNPPMLTLEFVNSLHPPEGAISGYGAEPACATVGCMNERLPRL